MAKKKHDSNTDIFTGQLFVFVKGQPIAFGLSANLDLGGNSTDISNKMTSGGFEASIAGLKNWSIASESLAAFVDGEMSVDELMDIWLNDELVEVLYGKSLVSEQTPSGGIFEPDLTKSHYKGYARIESLSVNSANGDVAKCSTTLKGVGALQKQKATPTT